MIKLVDILKEAAIRSVAKNNLRQLEQIEIEVKQTNDPLTKVNLAIKAAELVLPIWNYYYPKDLRVKQTIEAAKRGEYDESAASIFDNNDEAAEDAYELMPELPNADSKNTYENSEAAGWAANSAINAAFALINYQQNNIPFMLSSIEGAIDFAIEATKIYFKLKEAEIPVTGKSGEKVAAFKPKKDKEAFERGYKSIKTSLDPETGAFTQEFEALPKFDEIRRNILKYRREVQAFKFSTNEDVAKVAKDANATLYKAAQLVLALDKMLELQRQK